MISVEHTKYPKILSPKDIDFPPMPENGMVAFVEHKEDGSNIGLYLNEDGTLGVRSRNFDVCTDKRFLEPLMSIPEVKEDAVRFLKLIEEIYRVPAIIYGELMVPGYSPTKMFLYHKPAFKIFDVCLIDSDGERTYITHDSELALMYAMEGIRIPIVHIYMSKVVKDYDELNELFAFIKDKVERTHIEGVIVKLYENIPHHEVGSRLIARTKIKKDHISQHSIKKAKPRAEPIGDDLVANILQAVYDELGKDYFVTSKAVPRIVELCKSEAAEQNMSVPKDIHRQWIKDVEGRK